MKAQLLGFVQNGELLPQNPALHQQVNLQFLPQADGITFNLNGVFLDKVPPGRPVGWSGFPEGSPIGHAADATGISIDRIAGPVEKLDENTFRVNFTRVGTNNKMRSRDIWLMATHRGDAQYKRAVQQALLNIPLRNTKGAEQLITFPEIPSQKSGMLSVQLHAVSSLGAKVRYFVREGPAEVEGDTLKFTAIPPRAKFPVAVTVTAWQYGSAVEPKVITAETVTLKFWITK